VYGQVVPEKHFLRETQRVISWSVFSERLLGLYRGRGRVGRPPHEPEVILKMLVVRYRYDRSERETEGYVTDSLSAKWFLGLAVDEAAPDHSTLAACKRSMPAAASLMCVETSKSGPTSLRTSTEGETGSPPPAPGPCAVSQLLSAPTTRG
jgi:hypothetical protein